MKKSMSGLPDLLTALTREARARGLTDAAWARAAGVRTETLCRLRRRQSCDFATLEALAHAAGTGIGVLDSASRNEEDDAHFPAHLDRELEARLLQLCASGELDAARWARLGPRFFMAGLAVILASVRGYDRRALLELAERLHPGSSEPEVFAIWLARSPLQPSRFLPLLEAERAHAA